jgi:biotin transport system substrate-specific component
MKTSVIAPHQLSKPLAGYTEVVHVILGSLYIALLAQVEVPLFPIPMTLHTFAIFTLALFQGSKKSFYSILLYLVEATMGLPVFPGAESDPLWMVGPSAGYCLSFPLAGYVIGKFSESETVPSIIKMVFGLCCGQLIIYFFGIAWLSFSLGWEQALIVGLFPFVGFNIVKLLAAVTVKKTFTHMIRLYNNTTH